MTKDIKPVNEEGQEHGYWEEYWFTGNLMYKGYYNNGNRHGYWEEYYTNGNPWFKGNFNNGIVIGYWEIYHSNGVLIEQILYS